MELINTTNGVHNLWRSLRRHTDWRSQHVRRAAAVLLIIVDISIGIAFGRRHWFDLSVYYGAVQDWVRHGGHIYDYTLPGSSGYGFTYPPIAAVLMTPMALVGKNSVIVATLALNVAAAFAVTYWLVNPIAQRRGWDRWLALGLAGTLFALFDPVRDTISYGQINLILLALVVGDLRLLILPGRKFGGLGVGLAAAIKLTPAVLICYLLLSRRRSAGLVAAGTAIGMTTLGAIVTPERSWDFWSDVLWRTERVGNFASVTNQSLMGFVARFDPPRPDRLIWAILVGIVVLVWTRRLRAAEQAGDDAYGIALTCVVMCLVSPITWVHHLVWLIPPLVLMADVAFRDDASAPRRWGLRCLVMVSYAVLASGVIWMWRIAPTPMTGLPNMRAFIGRNIDFWVVLALFFLLPLSRGAAPPSGRA